MTPRQRSAWLTRLRAEAKRQGLTLESDAWLVNHQQGLEPLTLRDAAGDVVAGGGPDYGPFSGSFDEIERYLLAPRDDAERAAYALGGHQAVLEARARKRPPG